MKPKRFKHGEYDGWLYDADDMDTYLAQKDKEISELVEALERIGSLPNCVPSRMAKEALNKHKTINE